MAATELAWHQQARLAVDRRCLLAGLPTATIGPPRLIDARPAWVNRLLPSFASELARSGVVGVVLDGRETGFRPDSDWPPVLVAPPCSPAALVTAVDRDAIPVLGHRSDVYQVSAQAQRRQRTARVLIRVRNPLDLAADLGPTGAAAVIDALIAAPMVRCLGFWLDHPLPVGASGRRLTELFARLPVGLAVTSAPWRVQRSHSEPTTAGPGSDAFWSRPQGVPGVHDDHGAPATETATAAMGHDLRLIEPLWPPARPAPAIDGAPAPMLANPFTLEAWATPFAVGGGGVEVVIDLGWRDGLPDLAGRPILVGGMRGTILATGPGTTRARLAALPPTSPPWLATLLGAQQVEAIGPDDWAVPMVSLLIAIDRLASRFGCQCFTAESEGPTVD